MDEDPGSCKRWISRKETEGIKSAKKIKLKRDSKISKEWLLKWKTTFSPISELLKPLFESAAI